MIFKQLFDQLEHTESVINSLSAEEYTRPVSILSNATIGAHCRHIIEILQCAVNGYDAGSIDYYNRERDLLLEGDRQRALTALSTLKTTVIKQDKQVSVCSGSDEPVISSYHREVVYNMEHATHHLAMIKVGLKELGFTRFDDRLGVAYATIQYNSTSDTSKTDA